MTGRHRNRRRLPSPVMALAVCMGAVVPAIMTADTVSASIPNNIVITAFSDQGAAVGNGVPQEFDKTNASFSGTAAPTGINLTASGGTGSQTWYFVINPPPGTAFHVGYYPKVEMAAKGTGGQAWGFAGLDITGVNGCGGRISGGIDVRDLAVSGSAITRLDLLYEQHCDGSLRAVFGEIRIGEPQTTGLIVSSGSITWPIIPGAGNGGQEMAVPVYIRNTQSAPVSIGTASLRGMAGPEFSVSNDGCSGTNLAAGSSCALDVSFTASTRGPQSAALQVPLGTTTYSVQLDVLVRPGTSSLTMDSQPGDPVGGGNSYNFTTANSDITAIGLPSGMSGEVQAGSQQWGVVMIPPPGDVLADGTYSNATSWRGLAAGDGYPCNHTTGSFTIKQAIFSAVDNSLANFDATFIQYCDSTSALTGEFRYDAEPVTTTPGVSGLQAVSGSDGLHITWANPTDSNYRYTTVRIESVGSPAGVAPYAGARAYAGTGTSATVHGLTSGQTYTVVAYAVDLYGNASHQATYKVTI